MRGPVREGGRGRNRKSSLLWVGLKLRETHTDGGEKKEGRRMRSEGEKGRKEAKRKKNVSHPSRQQRPTY